MKKKIHNAHKTKKKMKSRHLRQRRSPLLNPGSFFFLCWRGSRGGRCDSGVGSVWVTCLCVPDSSSTIVSHVRASLEEYLVEENEDETHTAELVS